MHTHTKDTQASISPQDALQILKDGNQRFCANLKANRNLLQQVNETCDGQFPFAVILSCIDSRTSAELVFDQGLGDVFSIRIAGNFVNEDILGSMEFGCRVAGAKLVVVLGHSRCGAVKGACDNVELGHLTGLVRKIRPAVEKAAGGGQCPPSSDASFVQAAATENVRLTVENIRKQSAVLEEMRAAGEIEIVGAMYDVASGEVEFLAP